MPLNLQGLKDDLYVAFTLGEDVNPDSEQNLLNQIDAIAMAIDAYVRSGTVNGVTTEVAATIGTPPAVAGKGIQTVPVNIQ